MSIPLAEELYKAITPKNSKSIYQFLQYITGWPPRKYKCSDWNTWRQMLGRINKENKELVRQYLEYIISDPNHKPQPFGYIKWDALDEFHQYTIMIDNSDLHRFMIVSNEWYQYASHTTLDIIYDNDTKKQLILVESECSKGYKIIKKYDITTFREVYSQKHQQDLSRQTVETHYTNDDVVEYHKNYDPAGKMISIQTKTNGYITYYESMIMKYCITQNDNAIHIELRSKDHQMHSNIMWCIRDYMKD